MQGGNEMIDWQAPKSSNATYQDVLDAPPHLTAEIIDGTLYTHSRPHPPHSNAQSELIGILRLPFGRGVGGPGGWWIFTEPELHLGNDILVPDIAGWRVERMPILPATNYQLVVPDWVCEILSPTTRHLDIGRKSEIYAREGVGYLWLIDPLEHWLEASMLQGSEWVVIDKLFDDAVVSLPPFEAISFRLSKLWFPPNVVHKAVPEMLTNVSEPHQVEATK